MAWTFNGTGSQTTIPNGSHLNIPDGDWGFYGWFRLESDLSGTAIRRLLAWGTPAATPHLQIFYIEKDSGFGNADRLSGRFIDAAGNDTGIIYPNFTLSNHLSDWLGWCFTHEESTNTTRIRIFDTVTRFTYTQTSVQALGAVSTANIGGPLYIGATNAGTNTTRFKGDMYEVTYTPNLNLDFNTIWGAYNRGKRGFRSSSVGWSVPMLGDRTEVWGSGNTIITPSSTNVSTATYDNPQLELTSRRRLVTLEGREDLATQNVTSTLNFTQNAATPLQEVSANNTLNFVQSLLCCTDIPASASNALTLTDVAGQTLELSGNNVMVFASVVGHLNLVNDRAPCGSTLNLVQLVEVADNRNPTNNLGLTQTVNVQAPIKPVITQLLGITHHTTTPHRAFVTQNLGITDALVTPLPTQSVTSTLNFVQDAPIGNVDSTLNFVQTITFSKSLTARNTINLTHEMSRIMIYNRTLTHNNVVGHALTWYEDSPCGRKQYTPFQGENTLPLDVTLPSNTLGDPQGEDATFKLYIPYLGVHTSEVELRQPELDNRDRNAFSRASQETRGGKLIIFSDPIWPKIRTLAITVVGLTETQVDAYQAFALSTVGQEIGLTDWEGRLWKGFIKNPNERATQDGRSRWTVTFEFEGEMLDVQQPGEEGDGNGMAMNLTHSATVVKV